MVKRRAAARVLVALAVLAGCAVWVGATAPASGAVEAPRTETFDGPYYFAQERTTNGCTTPAVLNVGNTGLAAGTAAYSVDNCSGTQRGGIIIYPDSATVTMDLFCTSTSGTRNCEFYWGPASGTLSAFYTPSASSAGTSSTTTTRTATPGEAYALTWSNFSGSAVVFGVSSIGVVQDPAGPSGSPGLGTPPTTTTTAAPTTTTTSPAGSPDVFECPDPGGTVDRVECFRPDLRPFWVTVPAEGDRDGWAAPSWSDQAGNLFSVTGPLTSSEWQKGMVVGFIPSTTTLTASIVASGFDGSAGCEVWSGATVPAIEWSGQKQRNGTGTVRFGSLVPGQVYYVALAHDGGTGDAGSMCALDNLDRVSDRTSAGVVSTWDPSGSTNPPSDLGDGGPTSTGRDGLDDCIPSGWSLLNPFAYVGAIGCALEWAFVPSADTFTVEAIQETAADRVPFSWLGSVIDGGEEMVDVIDPGEVLCHYDYGYGEWFEANLGVPEDQAPGTQGAEWDAQTNSSNCEFLGGDAQLIGTKNVWSPRVRSLMGLLIWLFLAARLIQSAPWNKDKDGGEPTG